MRVHGEKVISRRKNIETCSDYHDYLPELREDFQHMCGYCGKIEAITKNVFEIDHFIPKKYAKEKENDYNNLVYSCYVCNRKKSDKWPSKDSKIQFVDSKGIVDPASDDYDSHVERRENGEIYGKSEVGKYMVEEVFKFNLRPIREVWQLMKLIEKKKQLREKIKANMEKNIQEYLEMDEMLDVLEDILFENKE